MILRAGQFEFIFPRPALVMGIVNVTPDSFSDGGKCLEPAAAVAQAMKLAEQGAEIIDIGGESSRPFAVPVPEEEELRRILPVIEQLAGRLAVPISIDTQKPAVARAALRAGASIVNDIAANRTGEEMDRLVAETGAGYVAMHMQGTPQTMQINPVYGDVVGEVEHFFSNRLKQLTAMGIQAEQVILDVGIGFGKTVRHNLELISSLDPFVRFNRPLLLGVSRKSFLGPGLRPDSAARLPGALACTGWGIAAGVNIIRTHDVTETLPAIRMTEALLAHRK